MALLTIGALPQTPALTGEPQKRLVGLTVPNTRYMKVKSIIPLLLAVSFCAYSCACSSGRAEDDSVASETLPHRLGFDPDTLQMEDGVVRRNEFFSNLLGRMGLSAQQAYRITSNCDSIFDVRKLRAGNAYQAYYSVDAADSSKQAARRLEYLVYAMDRVTDVVFRCVEPYDSWISEKPVTVERFRDSVKIGRSLWEDMTAVGVSPLLVGELSDIYAWTVDFFGLQKGDEFRVVYDMTMCEGEPLAVDTIRYAVFTHNGQDYPAIMFNQGDGGNIYWNEKGESMRKAFLKAPLRYSRVSSGFSYSRRHPVTRKVQPHTGVDYAAPAGTPVVTIGDGVVTSMKYEGAGGYVVRIKHNSVYSTAYLHLSKYAKGLKVGKRVAQGEVIGYVGSTGRSTGPHLDFRVWKNGSAINPLKMQSPPAEPIRPENRAAFDSTVLRLSSEIW